MSATPATVEEPESLVKVLDAPKLTSATAKSGNDRELWIILSLVFAIAFTFTVAVIGSILMALALRGSGVMGNLWTHITWLNC